MNRAIGMPLLILLATVGSGLMAGVFFAFSTFVMRALTRLPASQGIAAMQAINTAVVPSVFLGVFLLTALVCGLLAILCLLRWREPGNLSLLLGCLLYLLGTVMVTIVFNVPLNDRLATLSPDSPAGVTFWQEYLTRWTAWNHVRTVAALLSLLAFLGAQYIRR